MKNHNTTRNKTVDFLFLPFLLFFFFSFVGGVLKVAKNAEKNSWYFFIFARAHRITICYFFPLSTLFLNKTPKHNGQVSPHCKCSKVELHLLVSGCILHYNAALMITFLRKPAQLSQHPQARRERN